MDSFLIFIKFLEKNNFSQIFIFLCELKVISSPRQFELLSIFKIFNFFSVAFYWLEKSTFLSISKMSYLKGEILPQRLGFLKGFEDSFLKDLDLF